MACCAGHASCLSVMSHHLQTWDAGILVLHACAQAQSFKNAGIWSTYDYQTYTATFAFAYVLCGTYLMFFILLLGIRSRELAAQSEGYLEPKGIGKVPSGIASTQLAGGAVSGTAPSAPPASAAGGGTQNPGFGSTHGAWGTASYGNAV